MEESTFTVTITGAKVPDASDLTDILLAHKWPDDVTMSVELISTVEATE